MCRPRRCESLSSSEKRRVRSDNQAIIRGAQFQGQKNSWLAPVGYISHLNSKLGLPALSRQPSNTPGQVLPSECLDVLDFKALHVQIVQSQEGNSITHLEAWMMMMMMMMMTR